MPYSDYDFSQLMCNMVGEGTFGAVYKVERILDKQSFAVKIIDKTKLSSVKQEIELQMKVHHPNIAQIYEFFEHDGQFYIVMKLYSGDLQRHLVHLSDAGQQMKTRMVLKIFLQLVSALNYLHANDILHRDVKPHNLLIDDDIDIFLADFGIARSNMRTKGKTLNIGTMDYMGPELFNDCNYRFEPDVFAAGVVLFQMLHGCLPFESHQDYIMFNYKKVNAAGKDPMAARLNQLFPRIFTPYQNRISAFDILQQFSQNLLELKLPQPLRTFKEVLVQPTKAAYYYKQRDDIMDMYYAKLYREMSRAIAQSVLDQLIKKTLEFIQSLNNDDVELPGKKSITQKQWVDADSSALDDENANIVACGRQLGANLTSAQAYLVRKIAICICLYNE